MTAADPTPAGTPAQWEAWMTAWEGYLTAALALPGTPDAPAPALPDAPIPFGAVPAALTERLLRAQAVKDAALAAVAARLAELEPGTRFRAAYRPAPTRATGVDL